VDGSQLEPNVPVNVHPFSKVRLYDLPIDLLHDPDSKHPKHPYVMSIFNELKALNSLQLRENSEKMRDILLETCPGIVASAEKLSQNVCYFPVSTFGHVPEKVEIMNEDIVSNPKKDETGNKVWKIAPDPKKLRPFQIDIPAIWILSRAMPDLIPEFNPDQTVLNPG
jgi:hypothetical protein